MTTHIHSWTDGFLALREHAFATRGSISSTAARAGPARPATTS